MYFSEDNFIFIVTSITVGSVVVISLLVFTFYLYHKKNVNQQKLIYKAISDTQLTERQRIVEEISGEISANNLAILLHLRLLKKIKEPKELENKIDEIEKMLKKVVEDTQSIIQNIIPSMVVNYGLNKAFEELQKQYTKSGEFDMYYSYQGSEERLPVKVELNLYRMIMELINNTILHAGTTSVNLIIRMHPKTLEIIYEDQGKGFDTKGTYPGMGLKNIDSIIKLYKGKYELSSEINEGIFFDAELERKYME
jgi:signal transduction histidine kinase